MPNPERHSETAEPPPFLGRWSRVYATVLGYLAVLLVLLYAITRIFTY